MNNILAKACKRSLRVARYLIVWPLTFLLVGIVGIILFTVISRAQVERVKTLAEAKRLFDAVYVGNVAFNVPVLYSPYNPPGEDGWVVPDKARKPIDVIRIMALLPDMDYYNERTASEFEKPGTGRTISVYMKQGPISWQYYFDNTYKRLIKLPEDPKLPGMFHFRDTMDNDDVYLSHDKPVRDLTQIMCPNPTLRRNKSLFYSCNITTIYHNQFLLEYHYSLEFIDQWTEIDRKIKALLDSFIPNPSIEKGDLS